MLIKYLVLGFLFVSFSASANEKRIEKLDIQQPRTFGYQIGDKFERIVQLKLNSPYVLDDRALPQHGRITEWLSLEKPIVGLIIDEGVPKYTVKFNYQIVNIKPDLVDIAVPSHMLIYTNSDTEEKFNAQVPATRIRVSALSDNKGSALQADQVPTLAEHNGRWLLLYLTLTVISIAGFLYLKFGLPVFNKNHPFAKAHHALKVQRHKAWNETSLNETLQIIHQAFNETAQKTVFVEKLNDFFEEHKKFNTLNEDITAYFTESRAYFFEGEVDHDSFKYSRDELIEFTQKCSEAERGIR